MLRKTAGQGGGPTKSPYDSGNTKQPGGAKKAKVHRQTKERIKSTILFLLLVGLIGGTAVYVFKDSTDFDPFGPGSFGGGLRARVLKKSSFFKQFHSHLPPYTQLSELQDKYASQGFQVLAFPTNDFRQEPDDNEAIQSFLKERFPQVNFPVFGKTSLAENPVYNKLERHLQKIGNNDQVKHNFFKYLVNRKGIAVNLFNKKQDPMSSTIQEAIEELLKEDIPKKMTTV